MRGSRRCGFPVPGPIGCRPPRRPGRQTLRPVLPCPRHCRRLRCGRTHSGERRRHRYCHRLRCGRSRRGSRRARGRQSLGRTGRPRVGCGVAPSFRVRRGRQPRAAPLVLLRLARGRHRTRGTSGSTDQRRLARPSGRPLRWRPSSGVRRTRHAVERNRRSRCERAARRPARAACLYRPRRPTGQRRKHRTARRVARICGAARATCRCRASRRSG